MSLQTRRRGRTTSKILANLHAQYSVTISEWYFGCKLNQFSASWTLLLSCYMLQRRLHVCWSAYRVSCRVPAPCSYNEVGRVVLVCYLLANQDDTQYTCRQVIPTHRLVFCNAVLSGEPPIIFRIFKILCKFSLSILSKAQAYAASVGSIITIWGLSFLRRISKYGYQKFWKIILLILMKHKILKPASSERGRKEKRM